MAPKVQVLSTVRSHPYVDDIPRWAGPRWNVIVGSAAPLYSDYGYPNVSTNLSQVMYCAPGLPSAGPTQLNNLAPSGQYLESLESIRLWTEDRERPQFASLTEAVSSFRDSLSRLYETLPCYPAGFVDDNRPLYRASDDLEQYWSAASSPIPTLLIPDGEAFVVNFDHLLDGYDAAVESLKVRTGTHIGLLDYDLQEILETIRDEREERRINNLFTHLNIARRLVHRAARAFCGISWARRLWHLLHGSHPPKSESMAPCQALGCA